MFYFESINVESLFSVVNTAKRVFLSSPSLSLTSLSVAWHDGRLNAACFSQDWYMVIAVIIFLGTAVAYWAHVWGP